MRLRLIAVLVLLSSLLFQFDDRTHLSLNAAYAQAANTLSLSWDPPTMWDDGTALLEQDLDFYTLSCDGQPVAQIDSIIGTYNYNLDLAPFGFGSHSCTMTVTAIPQVGGLESDPSNPVGFTIAAKKPGAPSLRSP